ncbi:MAG: porin family protein [Hyphomicrobiales bacterium]|nr:porin family protein [Hyphomicrobiales bacterium]MCP5374121.1 porin family protein [Hyphomicrobiales bacterium]
MKKLSFITATSVSTIAFTASPFAAPADTGDVDWRGFYVGARLGSGFGGDSGSLDDGGSGGEDLRFDSGVPRFSPAVPFSATSNSGSFSAWPRRKKGQPGHLLMGIAGGYNWRLGDVVVGLEMDGSLLGTPGTDSRATTESFDGGSATGVGTRASYLERSVTMDWLYTVRPRVGLAVKRFLLFSSAGLAIGRAKLTTAAAVDEQYVDPGKGASHVARSRWSGRRASLRAGFILGGGVEYAVNDRLSVDLEGYYFNLGTAEVTAVGQGSYRANGGAETALSVAPYTVRKLVDGMVLRAGVNWRF